MRSRVVPCAMIVTALGCGGAPAAPPATSASSPANGAPHGVAFVGDDYARALADAKAKHVLLFVDAWAPWCHSCLSMREYALSSPSLAPLASSFVFAAIDTERLSNAAFTSKFANDVWPTLWIIDPETERATVKWGGTATADELVVFLGDATRPDAAPASREASAAFAKGNADLASGDLAAAQADFEAALKSAGAAFRERPRVVEALVDTLHEREAFADCIALAKKELPSLPPSSSRATVLATALDCADSGKLDAQSLLAVARADVARDDAAILADDRSALWDSVVSALEKQGDTQSARTEADAWAKFLEREAARAKTPEARAVFDPHRLLAYTAAGRERDAIPVLEASLRDFPHDYNPKARLAKVYFDAKDFERARAYIDAAFSEVYGPRTLRVAALAADIAESQKKREDATAFLRDALARTKSLPLTPKQKKLFAATEKRLSDLDRGAR